MTKIDDAYNQFSKPSAGATTPAAKEADPTGDPNHFTT